MAEIISGRIQEGTTMTDLPEGWKRVKLGDLIKSGYCRILNNMREPLSKMQREVMKTGECNMVDPSKAKYSEEKKRFVTKTKSAFILQCVDENEEGLLPAEGNLEKAVTCVLDNVSVVEQTWEDFFIEKEPRE